ncbi:MAG: histone deacetylase [Bacteriovoracaceae bacterium]|jgi:acetoin utilization deacetylase AcuC-like enzyme|nr:histone deacetylase [Bacteriovoracaceae bacterium]
MKPSVVYSQSLKHNLSQYGIEVPLKDTRAELTLEHLFSIPQLGAVKEKWFHEFMGEPYSVERLNQCHDQVYVDMITNHPEMALIKSFELVDDKGNYNRYNPKAATSPLKEMVNSHLLHVQALIESSNRALQTGFSYLLGGGMHHAMSFGGRGFCFVNDIVITLTELLRAGKINSAWVIDVDCHKGDGTAELTKDNDLIQTLSIHMKDGWPLDDQNASAPQFTPSTVDIPIGVGEEGLYLSELERGLNRLRDNSRLPGLCIVVGGADPYEKDILKSAELLKLSEDQMLARDMLVFNFLKQLGVPQSYCIAGGYGHDVWKIYANFLEKVLLQSYL